MKNRGSGKRPRKRDVQRFSQALLTLQSTSDCQRFLSDLCTPAELEAMVDRWRTVELLKDGLTYRQISQQTGISVTTVGRVARCLEMGSGGYELAWQRLQRKPSPPPSRNPV
jgi:TrpR-related protein YerC/YecD